MADKSITPDNNTSSASLVKYDLGRPNWESHRVPDLANPGRSIRLAKSHIIDVLILGDGFRNRGDFESQLVAWLNDFFAVDVYERFRGAFRVQALFQKSAEPVTPDRNSFYRIPAENDRSLSRAGDWWLNEELREKLFGDIERFDFNDVQYPSDLDVTDDGGRVIHNELAGMFSNFVVCMLTSNSQGNNLSGFTEAVPRDVGPGPGFLNVAFGANSLHEFGHAFAYLEDEYINGRAPKSRAGRSNPTTRSIFTLSNLSFSPRLDHALWQHLSPWGRIPRQGAGTDRSPTVGWLWRGGEQEEGVWHSEYHCLMNGKHDNYLFTSTASEDPTAQPDGTYKDETGARLRSNHRYCLWCQEIVVSRILEKTGQLAESGDPASINERGKVWYDHWLSKWRNRYWDFFDLDTGLTDREELYATQPNNEFEDLNTRNLELWRSDLYEPFHGVAVSPGAPSAVEDGEALLFLTA